VQLDQATAATFRPHLGGEFRVELAGEEPIALRLAEVHESGRQPAAPRVEPFVLVFTGPATPILPQATYRLEHDVLGTLDVFLVPIGHGVEGGVRYEAVFN